MSEEVWGRRTPSIHITTLDHYWHPKVLAQFENSWALNVTVPEASPSFTYWLSLAHCSCSWKSFQQLYCLILKLSLLYYWTHSLISLSTHCLLSLKFLLSHWQYPSITFCQTHYFLQLNSLVYPVLLFSLLLCCYFSLIRWFIFCTTWQSSLLLSLNFLISHHHPLTWWFSTTLIAANTQKNWFCPLLSPISSITFHLYLACVPI